MGTILTYEADSTPEELLQDDKVQQLDLLGHNAKRITVHAPNGQTFQINLPHLAKNRFMRSMLWAKTVKQTISQFAKANEDDFSLEALCNTIQTQSLSKYLSLWIMNAGHCDPSDFDFNANFLRSAVFKVGILVRQSSTIDEVYKTIMQGLAAVGYDIAQMPILPAT